MIPRDSRVHILLLAAAVTASAPACVARDRTAADTIVVAVDSNPRSLDPRFATDSLASKIDELVCPGLTARNASGTLVPELAESWAWVSPSRISFRLREGLVFSDGSPVEAEDVAQTYRSILDPLTASVYAGSFDEVQSIETPSPREVVFVLSRPSARILTDLVEPGIMKRGLSKEAQPMPVCAGAYRAVEVRSDEYLRLEANPRYWRGPPATAKLEFRIVPDATVRVLEVANGSADLVQNDFPKHFVPVLRERPHVTVETRPGRNVKYLVFNLKHRELGDARVRRAIAEAIDRDSLIRFKLAGLARPAASVIAPEDPFFAAGIAPPPFDVAAANALLDAAGLARGKDGVRFALEYKTSTNEEAIGIAKVIKHELAEVGIAVTIRPAEWGTFFRDINDGDFEMYSLTTPAVADPDFLRWMLASENIPPDGSTSNRGAYSNPEVDRLVAAGAAELDPVKRAAIYAKVQAIAARDLPVLPLWYETVVAAESDRLEGYDLSPFASYIGLTRARKRN